MFGDPVPDFGSRSCQSDVSELNTAYMYTKNLDILERKLTSISSPFLLVPNYTLSGESSCWAIKTLILNLSNPKCPGATSRVTSLESVRTLRVAAVVVVGAAAVEAAD